MEREEIKGFLLGISVGVGLGYYLLKPSAGPPKPSARQTPSRGPDWFEHRNGPVPRPAGFSSSAPLDAEYPREANTPG